MVTYEQIRFCEIKSNLNPHALSWYAEKEKASLSQGGLQTKPSSSAQTAAQQQKGRRNLGVDHLGRLSDAMGVSSDFLLKGCSENSTLVCKMLDDLKKKLQPSK